MANREILVEERSRDIGQFLVGRILPFREKRMVGPFIFVDHMGPSTMTAESNLQVDQHPHIGLSTLTYLLEGEIMHRDSIGTVQRIKPGEVNLMISGKGVTHTERTPEDLLGAPFTVHGYQLWIALPKDKEQMEPEFYHQSLDELVTWEENGLSCKLIIGEAFGRKGSLPATSEMFLVQMECEEESKINLQGALYGEIGILVNEGAVIACEHTIEAGNMLISKEEDQCEITLKAGSRVFLLGGKPFPEQRYIDWNFVSSDREIIEKARADWDAKAFPKVPEDETYIPRPQIF